VLPEEDLRRLPTEDPDGVNLRYLYVDSSDETDEAGRPEWKVLGRSVQLKKESQLLIKGMSLDTVHKRSAELSGVSVPGWATVNNFGASSERWDLRISSAAKSAAWTLSVRMQGAGVPPARAESRQRDAAWP